MLKDLPQLWAEKPNQGPDQASTEKKCLPNEQGKEHPPETGRYEAIQFQCPVDRKSQQCRVQYQLAETKIVEWNLN